MSSTLRKGERLTFSQTLQCRYKSRRLCPHSFSHIQFPPSKFISNMQRFFLSLFVNGIASS
uniref:Uncharacterized protein n=1 Tax=Anguilla anguilla TaxID=7936 RepID=A0A0E9QU61_ANGAN